MFSPIKMWIQGLRILNKSLCHLHTQFNTEISWKSIDTDFMYLNQSAHDDRESGFFISRMRKKRKVVVGHWQEELIQNKLGIWSRVVLGWDELQSLKIVRIGVAKGFDKVVWNGIEAQTNSTASIVLTYLSKDMEVGYHGNLETKVTYNLNNDNELEVSYVYITDKKTIVNLTQHSYFNLSGYFYKTIVDYEITIDADKFIQVDTILIPTGGLRDITNTPFDFKKAEVIEIDIDAENDQLKKGLGYNHCWF